MSSRSTPLGFVSSDIDIHSHCMFLYVKKDDAFVRSIADFLIAGFGANEISICVLDDPELSLVRDHLEELGFDVRSEESRFRLFKPQDILLPDGVFDSRLVAEQWETELLPLRKNTLGARVFCDTAPFYHSRLLRFKLLEFEALINIECPMTVTLCGYGTTAVGRTFLAQARNTHPFVANSRSIRRNPAFVIPGRFLSGLYRFRRVSREYRASAHEVGAVLRDIEELAARTPLTVAQIQELSKAMEHMFVHAVDQGTGSADDRAESHIHLTFTSESDKLIVTMRDHAPSSDDSGAASAIACVKDGLYVREGFVDDMSVESWKGDTIVTVTKRYSMPHLIQADVRV